MQVFGKQAQSSHLKWVLGFSLDGILCTAYVDNRQDLHLPTRCARAKNIPQQWIVKATQASKTWHWQKKSQPANVRSQWVYFNSLVQTKAMMMVVCRGTHSNTLTLGCLWCHNHCMWPSCIAKSLAEGTRIDKTLYLIKGTRRHTGWLCFVSPPNLCQLLLLCPFWPSWVGRPSWHLCHWQPTFTV